MGRTPIYKQISEELSEQIRDGRWPVGSRLPTEQQLAEQYSVSRITVRHALTVLAEQGYIRTIQGCGSVVTQLRKSAGVLGLVLSDFDDVFGTELLKGVVMEAERQGMFVIMQTGYHTAQQEGVCFERLLQMGVQGIVCVPLYDAVRYSDALIKVSRQIPIVFADRRVVGVEAPLVCSDNAAGVRKLYSVLKENGCRRVAFISADPTSTAVGERLKAFQEICTEEERKLVLSNMRTPLPGMEGEESEYLDVKSICSFLCRHLEIQGIIAHTYYVARLVQKAARQLKLSIPEELSLVCFDTRRENVGEGDIAYLQQDEYAIGSCAVRCLTQALHGQAASQTVRIPCRFMDAASYRRIK